MRFVIFLVVLILLLVISRVFLQFLLRVMFSEKIKLLRNVFVVPLHCCQVVVVLFLVLQEHLVILIDLFNFFQPAQFLCRVLLLLAVVAVKKVVGLVIAYVFLVE